MIVCSEKATGFLKKSLLNVFIFLDLLNIMQYMHFQNEMLKIQKVMKSNNNCHYDSPKPQQNMKNLLIRKLSFLL